MPDILIDPLLFVVPDSRDTREKKAAYLNSLIHWWQTTMIVTGCRWHFLQSAASLMEPHELFPNVKMLERLLQVCNAPDAGQHTRIDVNMRELHRWIMKCSSTRFENYLNLASDPLKQLLDAAGYLDTMNHASEPFVPDEFARRWPSFVQGEMHQIFEKLCLCAHLKYSFVEQLMVATRPFSEDTGKTKKVKVSTNVLYIAEDNEEDFSAKTISHSFPLLTSPSDLPFHIADWHWDGDEQSLRAAIDREYNERYRIEVEEIQKARREKQQGKNARKLGNQVEQHYPFSYTFSSEFLERLREAAEGATQENLPRRVVEAAAAIIADREHDKKSLHAKQLRESEGGGVQGRRRGEDKAWRIYITVSRGGWRLNYWKGPDPYALGRKRVEFAMMQLENNIPKI